MSDSLVIRRFGRFLSLLLCVLSFAGPANAYVYGEHKELGDVAFRAATDHAVRRGIFPDHETVKKLLSEVLDMEFSDKEDSWYFKEMSHLPNFVTYGALGGLAGDHSDNTMDLEAGLQDRFSAMNKTMALHNKHAADFRSSAPDKALFDVDVKYGLLAYVNYSHFYSYSRTLDEHLADVDPEYVRMLMKPSNVEKVFRNTNTHLIERYLTLHLFAITMAEKAGREYRKGNEEQASTDLYYAMLANAFADHFLEDAFAAGHLVVNRTFWSTLINSKSLHNFYNDIGLKVANLKGEMWNLTGDHYLNRSEKEYLHAEDYASIRLKNVNRPHSKGYTDEATRYATKYVRAVEAVAVSILDVWEAFARAQKGDDSVFLDTIPQNEEERPEFYLKNFEVLRLMPIPFGTNLDDHEVPEEKKEEMQKVVQLIPNRNFVRSRVANSFLFLFGPSVGDTQAGQLGARLNLSGAYNWYQDRENKTGSLDHWIGTTFSYVYGFSRTTDPSFNRFKLGPMYNLDVWVSRKRYFGVFSYLEIGGDIQQGDIHFLFSPSLGLQLGSLFGWDNYTLPRWIIIPLQFVLPVKVSANYNIIAGKPDKLTWQFEIDLLF